MSARFAVRPLGREDRSGFDSGAPPLDAYFHRQITQDIRRRLAAGFIAVERATDVIAGFYTLSAADVPMTDLPDDIAKKLPRYPTIPAARIGRLAVDQRLQGLGLGGALLSDAVTRASTLEIGVCAVVVEAKDDAAARFWAHHGFVGYGSAPRSMMAPVRSLLP